MLQRWKTDWGITTTWRVEFQLKNKEEDSKEYRARGKAWKVSAKKKRKKILKNTELGEKAERFLYGRKQHSNVQYFLTRYGRPAVKGGGLGTQGEQNGFDRAVMMGGGAGAGHTSCLYRLGWNTTQLFALFPRRPHTWWV
jgi:hypothetical protein